MTATAAVALPAAAGIRLLRQVASRIGDAGSRSPGVGAGLLRDGGRLFWGRQAELAEGGG